MSISAKSTIFNQAYGGDFGAVKSAVEQNKSLLKKRDESDRLLIHWAALGGHNDMVTFLISCGSSVNAGDDINMTPLILAASAGKENVVKTLIKEGADVDAVTTEGHSALQYAASKNWSSIVVLLLQNQADCNITDKRGATPLHRAASKGNIGIVRMLLTDTDDKININPQDIDGNTPLHLACDEEREDEAKLLVTRGANLRIENKKKQTPLDVCSKRLANLLVDIANARP